VNRLICPHSSGHPIGPSDCIWRRSSILSLARAHGLLVVCCSPHMVECQSLQDAYDSLRPPFPTFLLARSRRNPGCAALEADPRVQQPLITSSVIIVVTPHEPAGAVLRTVFSVLHRTPPSLLKEILLCDGERAVDSCPMSLVQRPTFPNPTPNVPRSLNEPHLVPFRSVTPHASRLTPHYTHIHHPTTITTATRTANTVADKATTTTTNTALAVIPPTSLRQILDTILCDGLPTPPWLDTSRLCHPTKFESFAQAPLTGRDSGCCWLVSEVWTRRLVTL
jgi:hypothetical protein